MGIFKDNSFFGLDIGNSAIRLVELAPTGSKPELKTYGSVAMPPGLFQSDSSADRQNLAGLIKQLVKKTKVSVNAVASLPGSQIYTAVIKVPKMSQAELAKAIKWQAEQHVPLGLSEVKIDWSLLPGKPEDTEQEVLVVAAPLGIVNKYAEILELAGLELEALEINPIAISRSVVATGDVPSLVLDIGALTTDIAVVDANVVRVVRNTQLGGEAMTRAVSKGLALDMAQAEQFKQKFGLLKDKLEGQVANALKPLVDSIVTEVDRARNFYKDQHQVEVAKVVMSGSTAQMPELALTIATALNLEVQMANPWAEISYHASIQPQLSQIALEYSTAVGLAMRGMK